MIRAAAMAAFERAALPDAVSRAAVAALVGRTARRLGAGSATAEAAFAREMAGLPIATHTALANGQHYELPPAFFGCMLGPARKYSCCLYETGSESLAEAERAALEQTIAHAGLRDGMDVLELGCGWGSLSLAMAERFPASRIVSVSNASAQRAWIEAAAARRGLGNLEVRTADMNAFAPDIRGRGARFDRIVSVEMFEHMANWRALLARARDWLAPEGAMFLHVFAHRGAPYRFDRADRADWIAQHFFSGGTMPSRGLPRCFPDLFAVEAEWWWGGEHYARTARDWLARLDAERDQLRPILQAVYGRQAGLWHRRWRLFLLATEGLFAHEAGTVWGVGHYLLRPVF